MKKLISSLLIATMMIMPVMATDGAKVQPKAQPQKAANTKSDYYVVEVTAEWCGPCKKQAAEVFPNAKVKEALKGFYKYQGKEIFTVDVDKYPQWCQERGVGSLPCVLILDKRTNKCVRRAEGLMTVDQFVNMLNKPFPSQKATTAGTQREEVLIFEGARTVLSWIAYAIYKILE